MGQYKRLTHNYEIASTFCTIQNVRTIAIIFTFILLNLKHNRHFEIRIIGIALFIS